jgi:hypothetical protein
MKLGSIYQFSSQLFTRVVFVAITFVSIGAHAYTDTFYGKIDFTAYDNQWDLIPDWPGYLPPDKGKTFVKAVVNIDSASPVYSQESIQQIASGTSLIKNRSFYNAGLGMQWFSSLGEYNLSSEFLLEYTNFRIENTYFDPIKNKQITTFTDWSGFINPFSIDEWLSEDSPEFSVGGGFNLNSPYTDVANGHSSGQLLENNGGSMNGRGEAGDIDFVLDEKVFKNKVNPPSIDQLFSSTRHFDILLDLYAGCEGCTQGTYLPATAKFSRVPEPAALFLFAIGLAGLMVKRKNYRG